MYPITLRAPGKNAMGSELMSFVRRELEQAGGAPVLIAGDGDAFSAGLDLKEVAGLDAAGMARFLQLLDDMVLDLYTYPGPVVACVNGHAIAGGCVMALGCDHRVMTTNPRARIGLNEVALGVRFPPRTFNMVRDRVPRRCQEQVLLGAALHDPPRALELGLVDELAEDPLAVARERLEALAKHPATAYSATKARMREGVLGPSPAEQARFQTEDLPSWTGDALKQKIAKLLGK